MREEIDWAPRPWVAQVTYDSYINHIAVTHIVSESLGRRWSSSCYGSGPSPPNTHTGRELDFAPAQAFGSCEVGRRSMALTAHHADVRRKLAPNLIAQTQRQLGFRETGTDPVAGIVLAV